MASFGQLLVSLLAVGYAVATPVPQSEDALIARPGPGGPGGASHHCKPKHKLQIRKSWHVLTNPERKTYIDAELCLMKKPTKRRLRGSRTIFDDFQSTHVNLTEIIHYAGQFLPYHRLFVRGHEHALQTECGYKGAQPYWDEPLDAGAFSSSIVFDPEHGFGGNGVGASRCIATGPFANYTNTLEGYAISDHCITRTVTDFVSWAAHAQYRDQCLGKTTYVDFWHCLNAAPHNAGHAGMGAQMSNPISSPGDPLFYLHHAYLDKVWAQWQAQNPSVRLTEMGGVNQALLSANFPGPLFPSDIPPPPGFDPSAGGGGPPPALNLDVPSYLKMPVVMGDGGGNVTTLNHRLQMLGLFPDHTIAEVMDTESGDLCYRYDV